MIDELHEKYGSLDTTLVGTNGNAFSIIAHFMTNAKRAGWEKEDIDFVVEEAQSKDYDHLLNTISKFTE